MRSVILSFLALGSVVAATACSASNERTSPVPAGTYLLTNDEETVMVVDDQGYFSWHVRTCGDWIRDSAGSFETDPDGSIHVYACDSAPGGGGAFWAPAITATKLRARPTAEGVDIDVQEGRDADARTHTQTWKLGNACRSSCDCALPPPHTGC